MARGGARNRSGPKADENSARSDARSYKLEALPAAGYDGPIPDFPLPDLTEREAQVWETTWRTPQACAWSLPSETWRIPTVAMWVRVKVRCEDPGVPATVYGQLHRFADQIGMTTAGLAEMGWKISRDGTEVSGVAKPKVKREPTLREQASAAAGWQVIDGERAG